MRVSIQAETEEDIFDSYRWYEERDVGLGEEFLRSIDACIATIQRNPLSYPIVHKQIRRALLRKFPHGIFYFIDGENLIVIACFHIRRDPKRLEDRM
jgi:toxin ParE1/3/4